MADMTVTVTMTAEEFVEFLEWKKDRAAYSAQLVKLRRLPEAIYKKLEYALEPDPKKAGKFKITDHEHLADLWDMAREFSTNKRKPPAPGADNTAQVAI